MWNVEDATRDIATEFTNSFQLVIFACCREVFNHKKHCGGFPTKEEADKFYADMRREEQAKILAVRDAEAKEGNDSDEEAKKKAAEQEKDLKARGDGSILKHVTRQNIIIMFGCKVGDGIAAKTNMVNEIAHIFCTRYDKTTLILVIPDVFDDLQSKDANFEMVVSNTLQ